MGPPHRDRPVGQRRGDDRSGRFGRRAFGLDLSERHEQPGIGVDVGGTKIAAGLVSRDGQVIHRLAVPTPARDASAREVEDVLVKVISVLCGRAACPGPIPVGIGAAGFVDAPGRVVRFSPHVAWREEPVSQRLSDRLGLPVTLENDANAAGWAEYRFGAAS
ncbi:MAG: ROK family protein, partial [Ornithinimicrobium sp.]